MYHEFYGLNRMPFQGSPDPDFLYPGPTHREALATIEYGVEAGMGFILLTGEVGLGKTTLIRTFLKRAARPDLFAIYVFHPLLSFEELLAVMAEELELEVAERRPYQLMRAIQRDLIARFEAGQRVVLIIDEAHRLPEETIENLRLISNLETDDAKLLQIVIVGQPELETALAQPRLRQLDQRITLRARLQPLSRAESEAYIRHRLQQAGAIVAEDTLAAKAIREIARRAEGVPRRINNLATLALIHGFGAGERPLRAHRVRAAAAAASREDAAEAAPRAMAPRRGLWLAIAFVGLAAIALGAAGLEALDDGAARAWLSKRLDGLQWSGTSASEPAAAAAPVDAVAAVSSAPAEPVDPVAPDVRAAPTEQRLEPPN
jgi:general secretion pathway protein A